MPLIRCDECNIPVMELRGRRIIIKSRHYGRQHVTVIDLDQMQEQQSDSLTQPSPLHYVSTTQTGGTGEGS